MSEANNNNSNLSGFNNSGKYVI